MNTFVLPNDVKKLARKRFIKKLLLFLIVEITLILFLVFLGEKVIFPASDKDMLNGSQYIIYGVLSLVPVYFAFVRFNLADRTYFGIITRVEIFDELRGGLMARTYRERKAYKTLVYITVKSPDGTQVRKKVHTDETANGINRFEKGKIVFHLYGADFTAILTDKTDKYTQCVVCGSIDEKSDKLCGHCGHTLIDKF